MTNETLDMFAGLLGELEEKPIFYWEHFLNKTHISINKFCLKTGMNHVNLYNWANGRSMPQLPKAFEFQEIFNGFTGQSLTVDEMWAVV